MLAERMGRVSASPTMRVLVEADKLRQQGIDVVEFGAGEPDFPTPAFIKAAAHAAMSGLVEIDTEHRQDAGEGDSNVIVRAGISLVL